MAIATTNAESGPYTANGSTTVFPFTFQVLDASHVRVVLRDGDGVETTVSTGAYSVSLTGAAPSAGTVTFTTAPTAGNYVVIYLDPPFTQDTEFENGSAWLAEPVNDAYDLAALRDQVLKSRTDRSLVAPAGESIGTLPIKSERAGKYLAFDDDGGPIPGASAPDMEAYMAAFAIFADGSYTYRTKALASADRDNIPDGTYFRVLVDESKSNTFAIYQHVDGVFEYIFSLGGATDQNPPATGALFDTDGADNFTDLIYTPDAALTVTDGSAAFSSSTAMDLILNIPALNGTDTFYHCFDDWTIDATFTVTSFPAAGVTGVHVGPRSLAPGPSDEQYGMQIGAHGGSATTTLIGAITANAVLEYTHSEVGLPKTIRVRYHHSLTNNLVTHTVNVDGGADIQLTQPYTTGTWRPPTRMMSVPIRFKRGALTCTKLKFSAGNPNTRFAFVGDSLTAGTGASAMTNGYAHLIRADYPGEVLIAGGSGSTTEDWLNMVESVVRMKPRYAFVCLGTNDRSAGWTVARSQAAMTTIINALRAADIVPIVLASPPITNNNVPTFNTWLAAQGWRYIDIYTTLLGTGTSLNAAYNSGDGVHWNDAGHLAVKNQVAAYIIAEGLA